MEAFLISTLAVAIGEFGDKTQLLAMMLAFRGGALRRAVVPLGLGAALALAVVGAYTVPYIANTAVLGVRDPAEVRNFSASLASYVTAPQENWIWGWTAFRFEGDELTLS